MPPLQGSLPARCVPQGDALGWPSAALQALTLLCSSPASPSGLDAALFGPSRCARSHEALPATVKPFGASLAPRLMVHLQGRYAAVEAWFVEQPNWSDSPGGRASRRAASCPTRAARQEPRPPRRFRPNCDIILKPCRG